MIGKSTLVGVLLVHGCVAVAGHHKGSPQLVAEKGSMGSDK
jgi:hypothetical protein